MFDLTLSQAIAYSFLAVVTTWATVSDLKTRRIPNLLNLTALVAGIVFQISFHGWSGLGNALAGFAIGFGTFFVLWMTGGGGGGDVKLMGALGAWLGFRPTLYVLVLSTVLVLVLTIGNRLLGAKSDREEGKPVNRGVALALPVTIAVWCIVFLDRIVTTRDLLSL